MDNTKDKEEKVFVVTRKMVWVTATITVLLIAVLATTWYLVTKNINKSNESASSSENSSASTDFTLTSDAGSDGGTLPTEYTCDGSSVTPALSWSNAPSGTKEFAVMMTTIPVDGVMKWSWVLYDIPSSTKSLVKGITGVGTLGAYKASSAQVYHPPCSQGSGLNKYTFTVYALSGKPVLPTNKADVTGEVLTKALSGITLKSATLNLYHQRSQEQIDNK